MVGERLRPEDVGFGRLFERMQDAVIVADAGTQRIVLWNQAAAKMFGYSASEALKLRVEDLVPEPLKASHRTGITRYARTGHGRYIDSDAPLDLPALKKSGEEISVELSLSPISPVHEKDDGEARFVLAIVRDVTGRRRPNKRFCNSTRISKSGSRSAPRSSKPPSPSCRATSRSCVIAKSTSGCLSRE